MAKKVLLDAQLSINGTDLTDWCSKVEVEDQFEEKETTTHGSGGAKEYLAGLESGTVSITFKNDYTAGQLDDIMWALRRQVVSFAARADGDAVSANNPQYQGDILINSWTPLAGSVGDVAEVEVQYPLSGPLDRVTST